MINHLKLLAALSYVALLTACGSCYCPVEQSVNDLTFNNLATSWDEAVPLGNATVGALIWNRGGALRFSLDRTDLWDLRPSDSLSGDNFRFEWVKEHLRNKDIEPVRAKIDRPYQAVAAPSKIPGAALEFSLEELGEPDEVRLLLNNALCEVKWANGTMLQTFVQADKPVGWFVFRNTDQSVTPRIVAPSYCRAAESEGVDTHSGQELERLGYEQGTLTEGDHSAHYHQNGWGDFGYDVSVRWQRHGKMTVGVWSITTSLSDQDADSQTSEALERGLKSDYRAHLNYWDNYWAQSSITLPDPVIEKQYQNEMYKFGSASRQDSYPISLQAVWTADNGKLPPWKGDYHHDLNTQLSYWPAYIGNHLSEGLGYLNTLWNQRDTFKRYTAQFFETDGLNVPGVTTLLGEPMGGWNQYSMSQTVAAWLSQHFYLHWKYSADTTFLKERGYPFISDVATCLEQLSTVDSNGMRSLEFSSSPEIFDNSLKAWFTTITNYDLALMRFVFKASTETASVLGLDDQAAHWSAVESELPPFDLDEDGSLTFAKGFPYNESHRHFSNAMAFHPLGLIDWSDGEESQRIIRATIKRLGDYGPDYWTGYSYSWLANMKARAMDGEGAAEALHTFAECFCLGNTFHVNGDQSGTGKSRFTYRPFTLEGNFAFASAVQEMLLQSHTGTIRVMPAIPASWRNVSFENLRAMGGFLVSAEMIDGQIAKVSIYSKCGGRATVACPDTVTVEVPADRWITIVDRGAKK